MKRFVFCLAVAVIFTACSKPYMVNSKGDFRIEYHVSDFFNMKRICYDGDEGIYWDEKSDVLYYEYSSGHRFGITPIMKPDGSCLTLSEWEKEHIK